MSEFCLYRQGDVLLIKVEDGEVTPGQPIERDADGYYTLALGESTGHAHQVFDPSAEFFRISGGELPKLDADEPVADRLLVVKNPKTELLHRNMNTGLKADHDPIIDLPKGNYIVRIQRRYDYFGAVRAMVD